MSNITFESSLPASPPANTVVASDTIAGIDYQRIKAVWGTTGVATEITTDAGLPVQITAQSSAFNIAGSVSVTSSTATIGAVITTPSTAALSISSSTAVIGSVLPSSQWTVTTTPSSVESVNLTSSALVIGSVLTASTTGTIGAVLQGTSPWVTSGSVNVTSGTVTLTSGTAALGSVGISSGTVTLTSGALALGSVTATLSSGVQVIGTVNQGTSPWVTSLTSGILPLGSVTVTSGTIASLTSGTVTLTSGALALGSVSVSNITSGTVSLTSGTLPLGTVTLSSGAVFIGDVSAPIETTFFSSGVLKAPVVVSATSSSSFYLLFTSAAATSNNRIVSASLSRTSSTEAIYGLQFMTSAAVALTGKIFMPPTPSNTVILPLNLAGWAQTTTTAIYVQTGVQLSTNSSVTATYIPL